jgi:hypothetical protein
VARWRRIVCRWQQYERTAVLGTARKKIGEGTDFLTVAVR